MDIHVTLFTLMCLGHTFAWLINPKTTILNLEFEKRKKDGGKWLNMDRRVCTMKIIYCKWTALQEMHENTHRIWMSINC